jgi:hypothetical protein
MIGFPRWAVRIHAVQVLETSAAGSSDGLSSLFAGAVPSVPTVFLHFGVNSAAKEFALEQTVLCLHARFSQWQDHSSGVWFRLDVQAHNDATFRIPDER